MGSSSVGGVTNVFGGGFGGPSSSDAELKTEDLDDLASGGSEDDYDYEEDADKRKDDKEVDALDTTLTNATITAAPTSEQFPVLEWNVVPAYPAVYLNTVFEYISPSKPEDNKAKKEGTKAVGGDMWDLERYERASDVDEVFQKFASRVAEEGMQCIRQVNSVDCVLL